MKSKKRIAFCWELGAGSGHLTGLLAVADTFVREGYPCALFVPDTAAIGQLRPNWTQSSQLQVAACPWWQLAHTVPAEPTRTYTLADVLHPFGFANTSVVSQHVTRWHQQLANFAPDVVVTEFAPGATMAARGRYPVVALGNGYAVLPDVASLPSLTSWSPEVPPTSRQNESAIIDAMNSVRHALGLSSWEALSTAFRGDITFVCTFSSLDPYRHIRHERVHVPFHISFPRRTLKPPTTNRGFVYLSFAHPTFDRLLSRILSQQTIPCSIYAPCYTARIEQYQGRAGHEILRQPLEFERIPEFAFCVHHGGAGTAAAIALAARPQLITPVHLEHALTGRALAQQRAAILAMPETIEGWPDSRPWIQAVTACLALPLNLHSEFTADSQQGLQTLANIQQQIRHC